MNVSCNFKYLILYTEKNAGVSNESTLTKKFKNNKHMTIH